MKIGIDARSMRVDERGQYARTFLYSILKCKLPQSDQLVIFVPEKASLPETGHDNVTMVNTNIRPFSNEEQTQFLDLLHVHKLDVMHFLSEGHPLRYRGASVFSLHYSPIVLPTNQSFSRKWLYRKVLAHVFTDAQMIMVPTQTAENMLVASHGVGRERIAIVPPSVDDSYVKCNNQGLIDQVLSDTRISKPYILVVGDHAPYVLNVIEAFASVHAKNRSLQLVISSMFDAGAIHTINQHIQRHRLRQNVTVLEAPSIQYESVLYSEALCVVNVSTDMPFDAALLKAFACECPVICANIRATLEVAEDAALYVKCENPIDIASVLHKVTSNTEIRSILQKAGKTRLGDFSKDKQAHAALSAYRYFEKKSK